MDLIVGGVVLRLRDCPGPQVPGWEAEQAFLGTATKPDLELTAREVPGLRLPEGAELAFDARPLWTMHRSGGRYLLAIYRGQAIAQLADVDPERWTGVVSVTADTSGDPLSKRALRYPLGLLLTSWRVAYRRGILLHACGVSWRGRGIAFCGRSNAGKSTTGRLWQREAGSTILNDDRVVARASGNGYRLSGTPWYGDGEVCSNTEAQLSLVLCLRHGEQNTVRPLGLGERVAEMLAASVVPYYDPVAMELIHDTCVHLAEAQPVLAYEFRPEQSAVEHVKQLLEDRK